MMSQSSGRRGLLWAIIGGLVLIAGIVAIIVASNLPQREPGPTPTPEGGSTSPTPAVSEEPTGEFVDPTASEMGWVPEPITSDADDLCPRRARSRVHLRHHEEHPRGLARLPGHLVHA